MTAGMCVLLMAFLSAVMLHSVSAGGVYCAQTARARAAALGLDYPGVHGAPDLTGQAHHGMHPSTMPLRPYDNSDPETELYMAPDRQIQPAMRSFDDRMHKQAHPRSWRGTYSPFQSEFTTDQALSPPRGRPVINRKSNFEEVNHVAPRTLAEARGRPDLVNWDPQSHNKLLRIIYNKHDLVDESVPNRRGMSLSGRPLPRSTGHDAHQRGLTGSGLGIEAPVLGSSGITNQDHVTAMTTRRLVGRPKGFIIMISSWVSVIVMLVAFVRGARNEDDIRPCAVVRRPSTVVPLGSPVRATCVIRDGCLLLTGQAVRVDWRLGDRLLPGSMVANESGIVSEVVVPSFNLTREILACFVQGSPVAGVVIRAGYPPEAPQNLSCQTNLTAPETLTCSWDPGRRETHLHTKYTLHTQIGDTNVNHTYELLPGVHRYTIPRSGFVLFSDTEIYVKAVNELGEAASAPVILVPVFSAKFDLPTIVKVQAVPKKYGCLRLSWRLSKEQVWLSDSRFNVEVRFKTADGGQWSEPPILLSQVKPTRSVDQCRLLHGTQYLAQLRVRYQQSPWSEWSRSQSGVTLESAPTGRLDSWMKVSEDNMQKQLKMHLFWKPSKQFRANGQNVSYIVSVKELPGEKGKVCSTRGNYCTFQIPRRVKKVYLTAVNGAGKSFPTEVRIQLQKARDVISDVTAIPQNDTSLLVQWTSPASSGVSGFVVEWGPLINADISLTQFEITDRNQTRLLLKGSFEPYKPYGISVYPRFKDGIGLPQTVNAYSRQKAPSMVPKIQIKKIWLSHVELTWDEVPLDQRNGFIQNYKVFYWDKNGHIKVVSAVLEERSVVLKDLNTASLYEAFLMVSTNAGSVNGSTIHFKIEPFDAVAVLTIVTVSCVGLSFLMIFVYMACFSNHKRLKGRFWPAVPDPANSSIKRWTSESTQDSHLSWDNEEPNPMYLSHLSFLDLSMKLSKEDDDPWLSSAEDTSDLGDSICGSPFIPGYSGSNSDSVPYATVIFSGPYCSPTPKDPHVYLRSDSTQPLLETEESFSPKCYQNITANGRPTEQCFFAPCHDFEPEKGEDLSHLWDDFPFLRALQLNDAEND